MLKPLTTHLQQVILAEVVRCVLAILSSKVAMIHVFLEDGETKALEGWNDVLMGILQGRLTPDSSGSTGVPWLR